jgi:hypothetical protein
MVTSLRGIGRRRRRPVGGGVSAGGDETVRERHRPAGCETRAHGTIHMAYWMGHGPRPISVVTTRNAVGLLIQL